MTIERITEGPVWDIKYGDDPVTGKYKYIRHRIEVPGRGVVIVGQEEEFTHFSWSTHMQPVTSIELVPDLGVKNCIYQDNYSEERSARNVQLVKKTLRTLGAKAGLYISRTVTFTPTYEQAMGGVRMMNLLWRQENQIATRLGCY